MSKVSWKCFVAIAVLFLLIYKAGDVLGQDGIVINEIMYNPSPDLGDDDFYEFVELFNQHTEAIDVSGWSFSNGFEFLFPEGTVLDAGTYIVIAQDPAAITDHYGISNVIGPFLSGKLNNGGEMIELVNADMELMDFVDYNDDPPWPVEPDGDGPSLELINPGIDNALATSWAASNIINGTPGIQNSVYSQDEILTLMFPNGGEVWEQGQSYDILWTSFNFSGEISIKLLYGDVIVETLVQNTDDDGQWTWDIPSEQAPGDEYRILIADSFDGIPVDTSDYSFSIVLPFQTPAIVITEIMYNPPETDGDSLEFIELYNAGLYDVNLRDFYFAEGLDYMFPDIEIKAGAYLLLAKDSIAMMNTFGVSSYQWTDGSLNNGGEELELRDYTGTRVDYVDYDNVLPWDTLADGWGASLAFCDLYEDNELPENWRSSLLFQAVNAAGDSIFATPGWQCSYVGIADVKPYEPKIFPNPCDGLFYLKSGLEGEIAIEVINSIGERVFYNNTENQKFKYDLRHLPSGFYMIRITNKNNKKIIAAEKLIIFR